MKTTNDVLRILAKKHDKILLVHREKPNDYWNDRCYYLEQGYEQTKPYNHRSILPQEIVIEFDNEDPQENKRLTDMVVERLRKYHYNFSVWDSGNKSFHIHFFVSINNASNIPLLKHSLITFFTKDLPSIPDLQLSQHNHLIRAEFGLHEKTRRNKTLLYKTRTPYEDNTIISEAWKLYTDSYRRNLNRRVKGMLTRLDECECIKYIADTARFGEHHDGHERALFILVHALKSKYSVEDLTELLWQWYEYSGGKSLSKEEVTRKIRYNYSRDYGLFTPIRNLLYELGVPGMFDTCPVHGGERHE